MSLSTGSGSDGDAAGDTLSNIENLTGSNYDDTLEGDANRNVLNGGKGTDTVSYEHATSAVTVNLGTTSAQNTVGAGTDRLSGFENILGSAFDDLLTGSRSTNVLTGGAGNDRLDGGAGADTLIGGLGDDTYIVDNARDVVDETDGGGTDLVMSSVAFTLGAGLENLTLTGTRGVAGTGNDADNILIGNAGANVLTGFGGNDTLTGGAGKDTFAFTSAGFGQDMITDFDLSRDVIRFNPALFANYAAAMASATQVGTDTVITSDTDTITLANVAVGSLTQKNFAFG